MKPDYLIFHHSLTKDSGTVSWLAIRNYHMTAPHLRFRDIGYHFGIELVGHPFGGESYEILFGRMPHLRGAHCVPRNSDSLGICLVGNFDDHNVPPEQWEKAVNLCVWLKSLYGIPVGRILGHREAQANRTCPGRNFDMDMFRANVQDRAFSRKSDI